MRHEAWHESAFTLKSGYSGPRDNERTTMPIGGDMLWDCVCESLQGCVCAFVWCACAVRCVCVCVCEAIHKTLRHLLIHSFVRLKEDFKMKLAATEHEKQVALQRQLVELTGSSEEIMAQREEQEKPQQHRRH